MNPSATTLKLIPGSQDYNNRLISLHRQHGGDWPAVARELGQSTASVSGYFGVLVRKGLASSSPTTTNTNEGSSSRHIKKNKIKYKSWSREQDEQLLRLHRQFTEVSPYGAWVRIAQEMTRLTCITRTDRAC